MNFFKKTLVSASAIAMIFVASCSDDSSTNTNNTNTSVAISKSFPISEGSFWINDSYTIDSMNVKTKASLDSIVCYKLATYKEKSNVAKDVMFTMKTGSDTYMAGDTSYYSLEGNKLYVGAELINNAIAKSSTENAVVGLISSLFTVDQSWLLVANSDASTWDIYSKQIKDQAVTVLGQSLIVNANMTVKGTKGIEENLTIAGKSVKAQKYTANLKIEGTGTLLGTKAVDFSINVVFNFWTSEGIGIVKRSNEGNNIKIVVASAFQSLLQSSESVTGKTEDVLIRYSIK